MSARSGVLIASVFCVALAGVLLLPPSGAPFDAGDGMGPATIDYQAGTAFGGTLNVIGPIGSATVRELESQVSHSRGGVSAIRIRSLGGIDVAAVEFAHLVDRLGADLVLEDNAVCASACVILVAAVSEGHRHLAPGAWLFVHPETRALPETQDELNRRAVAQSFGDAPDDPEGSMERWVASISQNWLSFLKGCKLQPLLQRGGLAMTWAEIELVDKDPSSLDCDRIAYRDVDWLRANLTPDLLLLQKTL